MNYNEIRKRIQEITEKVRRRVVMNELSKKFDEQKIVGDYENVQKDFREVQKDFNNP